MSDEIQPLLLRVGEVCSSLGMSRSAVYREIHNGNLNALKIGKSIRISNEELARYVASIPFLAVSKLGGTELITPAFARAMTQSQSAQK